MRRALGGLVAAAFIWGATGCGGGGVDVDESNASAPPAEEYADTLALLTALDGGGLTCTPAGAEDGGAGRVEECERPDGDIVTAWVFADAAASIAFLGDFIAMIEDSGGFDLVLQGPNWVLTASRLDGEGWVTGTGHDDLLEAQTIIGGDLIAIDPAGS